MGAILSSSRPESRVGPPDPTPHVRPKPEGAAKLPRLLLVKPDRTGDEFLDGLCGHGETFRAVVIGVTPTVCRPGARRDYGPGACNMVA